MTEKLLPCPFCGEEASFERLGDRRQSCIIECGSCGCRLETGEEGALCGSAWNRRAAQPVASAEQYGVIVCDKRIPNAMQTFIPERFYDDSRWPDSQFSKVPVYAAPVAAQPSVPEPCTDMRHHERYITGWNACRDAMLAATPADGQAQGQCAGCGKRACDGWALYCVKCGDVASGQAQQDVEKMDAQPAAYCQSDDPDSKTAFSWPGSGKNPKHTKALYLAAQPDPAMAGDAWLVEFDGLLAHAMDIAEGQSFSAFKALEAKNALLAHARLRVQPASAEDAKRLDWLARQDLDDLTFTIIRDAPNDGEYCINAGRGPVVGKTFRAAIDAATQQERQP